MSPAALLLCVNVLTADEVKAPAPNSPDEPLASRLSLERAASFLDAIALTWTRERKCGTCHTNYAYLFARPAIKGLPSAAMEEVRRFFEDRAANWDTAKPKWDTEVVATAVALAVNDAGTTGKLHPLTRKALDRMWTLQREDGAWEWLKCDWPPMEHDDYFGAVYAAVGAGAAPESYASGESARAGLEKLRKYLKTVPPPSLHHEVMLLWAATRLEGLLTKDQMDGIVKEVRAAQRADGGWSLVSMGAWKRHDGSTNGSDAPSDGYGTGLAAFVLRQARVPPEDPSIAKAVRWLETHQRESGRWFTRSPSSDERHYISHAGTAYAVMALAACGVEK